MSPLLVKASVFMAVLLFFLRVNPVLAQGKTVTGRVSNNYGDPLANASVIVKGTTTGTTTDNDGRFSIATVEGSTLVISSVNYLQQEVRVGSSNSVTVKLSSAEGDLGEVVVVGYGTVRKKDLTGAVTSVKGTALREVPAVNLVTQLQGQAAGVDIQRNGSRPGAGGQIRIRGERSLGTTQSNNDLRNNPLIILDGIPFGGSINDINPDDIESLEILKDASATAIYGSRGSNGVILITTKRGRPGKTVVSYNAYYGFINITKELPVLSGAEYAKFKEDARIGAIRPSNPNPVNPYPLTQAEQQGLTDGTNTDWQGLMLKTGNLTNHELNVSGGSENGSRYSLGLGFYDEIGVVPGQDIKRYSIRTTIDQKVGKRITVGINSLNSLTYANGEGLNPVPTLYRLSPLVKPYNADGSLNWAPVVGTNDGTTINPLTIIGNGSAIKNQRRRITTFNSLYSEIKITNDIKYRVNVGLSYRQEQTGSYLGPNTLYNNGGFIPTTTPITFGTAANNANESVSYGEGWSYTVENILSYDKLFMQKHRIGFTGLYSVQKDHSLNSGFSANGVPSNSVGYTNLALATANLTASNGGFSERGLISYMARLNYAYNDKYLLTATVRTDGSSVLSSGHQWYTFPAFVAAWNATNESFLKNISWLSSLKVRAGWGKTADQGIDAYSTLGLLSTDYYNFGTTNAIGYFTPVVANKQLKWESTAQWNYGIDFGILKNGLTGSIEYFTQQTSDILLNKNLPRSTGTSSTVVNAGKTKGHGLEITLNSVNMRTKDFSWTTDFNFSTYRDKIVALAAPGQMFDKNNGWFVGQPLQVIYDVRKIGIWQTSEVAQAAVYGQFPGQIKIQDVDKNNSINADDRQILGNFQPDWIGGMTNRFTYKEFDLSVVLFARMGQTVVVNYLGSDGGANGYPFFNNSRVNTYRRDYWTPTNPTNEFPSVDASSDNVLYSSTLTYRDGSFIRCRSINLGYTLPSRWISKAGLTSLRVYFSADNPFFIYAPLVKDDLALDPEGNGYGGSINSGASGTPVQGRSITVGLGTPPTRQYIFGVNVKF